MILGTLQQSALSAAEQVIHTALQYDPAACREIAELDGKVVLLTSTLPPMTLYLVLAGGRIHLHNHWEAAPDTTLRGTLPALAAVAVRGGDRLSLANSGVTASGDEDVLRRVSRMLKRLDIDWEALLAELIGDVPAHMVGQSVRSATAWGRDSGQRVSRRVQLAVTEELRLLPGRAEVDQWRGQVNHLRQDADRLAARLARLQRRARSDGDT